MAYILQKESIPFEVNCCTAWTHTYLYDIKIKAEKASRDLAAEYGEPLWCKGTGMRNTHLLAIAPTVSNSKLSGDVSAGMNLYLLMFIHLMVLKEHLLVKNPELEKI